MYPAYAAYTANNDYTMAYMPTYMVTNRWLERRCYDMVILLFANVTIWAAVGISFFLQKLNFPAKQATFVYSMSCIFLEICH